MPIRGCWSCGEHGPCYDPCECAKCVDPDGYDEWKTNVPEQYEAWLERQYIEHENDCGCPSCQ